MKALLEADPPYGGNGHLHADQGATGWNAPPTAPWLSRAAAGIAGVLREGGRGDG